MLYRLKNGAGLSDRVASLVKDAKKAA
jgi:ribosomal protein S16